MRQITVKRGLDVRDFPMVTFGGSGSLLACRLMDILGLGTVLVPPDPGNVSAFGLLTVDVRTTTCGPAVHAATSTWRPLAGDLRRAGGPGGRGARPRGLRRRRQVFERSADLRYVGQAFEVRVPAPAGRSTRRGGPRWCDRFHDAHGALYGYGFRGDRQQTSNGSTCG